MDEGAVFCLITDVLQWMRCHTATHGTSMYLKGVHEAWGRDQSREAIGTSVRIAAILQVFVIGTRFTFRGLWLPSCRAVACMPRP